MPTQSQEIQAMFRIGLFLVSRYGEHFPDVPMCSSLTCIGLCPQAC